jgi:protein-L-isoaspartate(D-aspartate) O-methyltransferase
MLDTYKHKGLRKQLVQLLKSKKISDELVLKAMEKVPRHFFMDTAFLGFAYDDKAFPIGADQTISQPYTVAFQTQLLELKKTDKVLEIGTGSGYQTCILCELVSKVYSIERQKFLFDKTSILLKDLQYQSKLFFGDGYKGLPSFAPFDKILITCGAPEIPEELLKQLKIGGIMIIPIGEGENQMMVKIERKSDNDFLKTEHGNFRFVPMLQNKERSKG